MHISEICVLFVYVVSIIPVPHLTYFTIDTLAFILIYAITISSLVFPTMPIICTVFGCKSNYKDDDPVPFF